MCMVIYKGREKFGPKNNRVGVGVGDSVRIFKRKRVWEKGFKY